MAVTIHLTSFFSLFLLIQKLEETKQEKLQEREEALFEQIRKEAHLSSKEAEKLMNKHLEDLKESNGLLSSSVLIIFFIYRCANSCFTYMYTCTFLHTCFSHARSSRAHQL